MAGLSRQRLPRLGLHLAPLCSEPDNKDTCIWALLDSGVVGLEWVTRPEWSSLAWRRVVATGQGTQTADRWPRQKDI